MMILILKVASVRGSDNHDPSPTNLILLIMIPPIKLITSGSGECERKDEHDP